MLGYVQIYTPKAKETIRSIIEKHLGKYHVDRYTDNILTIVDELIKNAVKANYKYLLIRDQLADQFKEGKFPELKSIEEVFQNRELYSEYAEKNSNLEENSKIVRTALTQESQIINLKTKANKENRKYTNEEMEKILSCKELLEIHKKSQKYKTRVQLRVNEIWNYLNIEIMNNAPILGRDLGRIHQKRTEFKEYADRGEEMMFFINNMDATDGGAGLGYATIDSCIKEMKLDPFKVINIISVTNTTVLLGLPINDLKKLSETENDD